MRTEWKTSELKEAWPDRRLVWVAIINIWKPHSIFQDWLLIILGQGSKMQSTFESLFTKRQSKQLSKNCVFLFLQSVPHNTTTTMCEELWKTENIPSHLPGNDTIRMWAQYVKLNSCVSARMAICMDTAGNCTIHQDFTSVSSCHVRGSAGAGLVSGWWMAKYQEIMKWFVF